MVAVRGLWRCPFVPVSAPSAQCVVRMSRVPGVWPLVPAVRAVWTAGGLSKLVKQMVRRPGRRHWSAAPAPVAAMRPGSGTCPGTRAWRSPWARLSPATGPVRARCRCRCRADRRPLPYLRGRSPPAGRCGRGRTRPGRRGRRGPRRASERPYRSALRKAFRTWPLNAGPETSRWAGALNPQGPPEGPAASPGRRLALLCSLAGQQYSPGRTIAPVKVPGCRADRTVPRQGHSPAGCARQMMISRAFRRPAGDPWPYRDSTGRAVRRAAGDLRPCPARAGGSILQARREVSSQKNLTAASRRKVGRLIDPGRQHMMTPGASQRPRR